MAGYEQLAKEIQRISKDTVTHRPVIDEALSKSALGHDFKAHNITVTQPLADGDLLLRHTPPDGHDIMLYQNIGDNSLRIYNDTSGETSAWFYADGRAYVNLTDFAVDNQHLADLSVGPAKLRTDSVTEVKIAGLAVTNGKLGAGAVGTGKVLDDAITRAKMNSDTQNQSQGTSSMRSLSTGLGGSSLSGSPGNHAHLSVNFNSEYTLAEKESSANLKTAVEGMRQSAAHTQIYPLLDLVIDLAHQLMDDPGVSVQEKVRRIKEDPAYAHEFRMQHDDEYFAAWAIANDAAYAAKVQDDPRIQQMAAHAWQVYTRIEDDPAIVEDYKRRRGPFA